MNEQKAIGIEKHEDCAKYLGFIGSRRMSPEDKAQIVHHAYLQALEAMLVARLKNYISSEDIQYLRDFALMTVLGWDMEILESYSTCSVMQNELREAFRHGLQMSE